MITEQDLKTIMPFAKPDNILAFLTPLNLACHEYQINTDARIRMFLANVTVESGSLQYVKELDSGVAYEGRKDLGNTSPGDGPKYKGRGLLQITGKFNYDLCGKSLGLDLVSSPELLEQPIYAAESAGWFWSTKGLNDLADQGNFFQVCARINGINKTTKEPNGYPERVRAYNLALTRNFNYAEDQ
jgi:putative chitinase